MKRTTWSLVKEPELKPPGWWQHKFLCEFWYKMDDSEKYHYHLDVMIAKYGFNLYGEAVTPQDQEFHRQILRKRKKHK